MEKILATYTLRTYQPIPHKRYTGKLVCFIGFDPIVVRNPFVYTEPLTEPLTECGYPTAGFKIQFGWR